MIESLLQYLADRLGVEPPRAGEAVSPHIRFEQPWPQWALLAVVLGGSAFVVWLYRREPRAPAGVKAVLAGLRISLVLLTVFLLSEAALSVDRTGLPYLAVLVDDSASAQIADQYEKPEVQAQAAALASDSAKAATEAGKGSGETSAPGANGEEATRLAVAKGLLLKDDAAMLRALQKQHRVRLYLVSNATRLLAEIDRPEDVEPAVAKLRAVEPVGPQTRLGDGVRQVLTELRGAPPSALILLSDGQTTEGEPLTKAAELAARKGVPLFTVGVGSAEPARDLELTDLLVDDVVFVDDAVRFQAKLAARGFEGRKVTLRLRERPPGAKADEPGVEIKSIEVDAPPDGKPARVEIVHEPKETGEKTFVLEVDPRPRELQVDNNRIERTVSVRKEKLKVLLVESEPRYEFRYLKNYLEREETIDLSVVLLSSDPEYSEQDRSAIPVFPASKEDLFGFDVVLFGDVDPGYLSQAQMRNLAEFATEKGGGVLFVAGQLFNPLAYRGTPLEALLPIELSDARDPAAVGASVLPFHPELTLEGRASPIFRFGGDEAESARIWRDLPESFWYFEAPRKKPAALVLVDHPTATGGDGKLPLILYQFAGSGRTMFHAFDDTWRWRFRAGDRYFGRFWVQTIRFLARSRLAGKRQAEIQTDRRAYERGQPVQVRVRFPNPGLTPIDDSASVQIERQGGASRTLKLQRSPGARNVFEGVLAQATEGEYTARLLPPPVLEGPIPTAAFRVEAPAGEFEKVQMNESELRRASAVSPGAYLPAVAASGLLDGLPKPSKVPLDTDPPIPLWNSWPILALFLLLLASEWILRKRARMV
ncbi:VWA domain-containing protein [Planctomyces sp. SH-PL62]|uniref:VWA domain-containing protein n=1 Tax=Planctomyces sp. SH-PL62 TaxID=1636152 RepID=UPI00078D398A|nr:VWA domain-containing protein [Planctomyces sp. SH-PL62]AMV37322.1 von Willebrand factor type A domain protein [Planctomyces sp. SH-PL62]